MNDFTPADEQNYARFGYLGIALPFWKDHVTRIGAVNNDAGGPDWISAESAKIATLYSHENQITALTHQLATSTGTPPPGYPNAFSDLNYYEATGNGNAYEITAPSPHTQLRDGQWFLIKWPHTNTDPATLKVDELPAADIVSSTGNPIIAGGLQGTSLVQYNGSGFMVLADKLTLNETVEVGVNPSGGAEFATLSECFSEINRFYTTTPGANIVVNLSGGVHNVSQLIHANSALNVVIRGQGRTSTTIREVGSNDWAIQCSRAAVAVEAVAIENGGVISTSFANMTLKDVIVRNAPVTGVYCTQGYLRCAENVEITASPTGIMSVAQARIDAAHGLHVHHNVNFNARASTGYLNIDGALVEHSKYGIHAEYGAVIRANRATARNHSVVAMQARYSSPVIAFSSSVSANNVNYSPAIGATEYGAYIRV